MLMLFSNDTIPHPLKMTYAESDRNLSALERKCEMCEGAGATDIHYYDEVIGLPTASFLLL